MKKRMICVISIAALIFSLTGCGAEEKSPAAENKEVTEQPKTEENATQEPVSEKNNEGDTDSQEKSAQISKNEAKKIALKDAGLSESELSAIRVKLDTDDGVQQYEVEFYADGKEYDYDIDAKTGKIRSKDTDIEDDFGGSGADANASGILSKKDAEKIALKKVPGATEKDVYLKLEHDDGRQVYEGSVIYKKMEYEFEIDAETGKILSWEEEPEDD